jgi:GntR family transcriptional regulator
MSPVPMYEKISNDLLDQITTKTLTPGDRIPSETELATQYGVSRMTVRQALDQLLARNVVVKRRGAGTFVTQSNPRFRRLNRLQSFRGETGLENANVRTEIKFQGRLVPPAVVAERLGLKPGQEAVRLQRIRVVEGTPAAIQDTWLPYTLAPQLARVQLIDGSLYRTLSELCGIRLSWAEQEISASAATTEQAAWLLIARSSPLIATIRLTYQDAATPIEYTRAWSRPEFPLIVRLDAGTTI